MSCFVEVGRNGLHEHNVASRLRDDCGVALAQHLQKAPLDHVADIFKDEAPQYGARSCDSCRTLDLCAFQIRRIWGNSEAKMQARAALHQQIGRQGAND
jgi:hypothetical protein